MKGWNLIKPRQESIPQLVLYLLVPVGDNIGSALGKLGFMEKI